VWVLDPRRTETAALADMHIPVKPGADVAVLAALSNALLMQGADERELREHCDATELNALRRMLAGFTLERAAAAADVDVSLLEQLVADMRASRGRIAMHCGTGVTMARDGVLAEWLRWVVLIASGSLDRASGMHFHRGLVRPLRRGKPRPRGPGAGSPRSRPELPRVLGQIPAVALADEIEAGNIRALVVTGGNPLTAFPQPARLRAAFERLELLAVVDVADNPLTAIATHVLPATGQLERADLTLAEMTALHSGLQATRPVVEPVADRRPVWWMFAALNKAMGRATPGVDDLDQTDEQFLRGVLRHSPFEAEELFAAGPHGIDAPVEHGWVHEEMLEDGRWHIAPTPLLERLAAYTDPEPAELVLAPRREMAWSNSVVYGATATGSAVRMHPDTVRTHAHDHPGVAALATDHGDITATVVADATVRGGVVSITHGRPHENPGELTSSDVAVDNLTAMPRVSGLEVRVSRSR
jgi:anaerobic selenocysteine-containing dehydrogenase